MGETVAGKTEHLLLAAAEAVPPKKRDSFFLLGVSLPAYSDPCTPRPLHHLKGSRQRRHAQCEIAPVAIPRSAPPTTSIG